MLNFDQKDGSVNENVRASLSTSDCLLLGGGARNHPLTGCARAAGQGQADGQLSCSEHVQRVTPLCALP